jgi:hypothetical protein
MHGIWGDQSNCWKVCFEAMCVSRQNWNLIGRRVCANEKITQDIELEATSLSVDLKRPRR